MTRGDAAFGAGEDLRGRDLREARLGRCDLAGRDLSGADLSRSDLRQARLSGATLRGARLTGARLRQARLDGADLDEADLRGADLCGADLTGARLTRADLDGAILDGACMESADLSHSRLAELSFRNVRLQQATLEEADLTGAQLTDGRLQNADLTGAKLDNADLSFADLTGATLAGASLVRANLSGSNLESTDLRDTAVKDARLSWVLGLSPETRRDLLERGAHVPASRLAGPWAWFNALARRQAGLLYMISLIVVTALAMATALWVGGRMAGPGVHALQPAGASVHQVDCGSPSDRAFSGRAGYVGGQVGRVQGQAPIKNATLAPDQAYRSDRRGEAFGYRFRVSPGWYELQLHFAELFHRGKGARTFDISVEEQVVARSFDILSQTYFGTALVRRWAVRVDDGFLDVRLRCRTGQAKVNFIRVSRLDIPVPSRPQR